LLGSAAPERLLGSAASERCVWTVSYRFFIERIFRAVATVWKRIIKTGPPIRSAFQREVLYMQIRALPAVIQLKPMKFRMMRVGVVELEERRNWRTMLSNIFIDASKQMAAAQLEMKILGMRALVAILTMAVNIITIPNASAYSAALYFVEISLLLNKRNNAPRTVPTLKAMAKEARATKRGCFILKDKLVLAGVLGPEKVP